MIHRAELVGALASLVPEAGRFGFECVGVQQQQSEWVTVRFANGHTDEADAVIGADGINSTVRAILFGRTEPRYAGDTCWRGVCPRRASLQAGYIGKWWGRGKRCGITTLIGDRVYWFATHNAPASRHSANELSVVAAGRGTDEVESRDEPAVGEPTHEMAVTVSGIIHCLPCRPNHTDPPFVECVCSGFCATR
jgi:2-polyprenyl-6-methoxyphenol hydroxylase-like FAD-dependent oxidoreductase